MGTVRRHLTYANVVSTLCLFLVVAGGAAYAANTVFSSDIVDNEVFSADVRNDTLSGGGLGAIDLASGSVRSGEISNDEIRSIDVRDDTLSGGGLVGADVVESSLGTVPDASALDGLDSSRFKNPGATGATANCAPLAGTETCASATVPGLTTGDDVYVSAWWRWSGHNAGADQALCEIRRGTAPLQQTLFGQNGNEHDDAPNSLNASLIALDTAAPAGTSIYSLSCREDNGDVRLHFARVIAFRLSG